MSNYFYACRTKEEAKKVYRELSKKLHPDHGGTSEKMAELNRQYNDFSEEDTVGSKSNDQDPFFEGFNPFGNRSDPFRQNAQNTKRQSNQRHDKHQEGFFKQQYGEDFYQQVKTPAEYEREIMELKQQVAFHNKVNYDLSGTIHNLEMYKKDLDKKLSKATKTASYAMKLMPNSFFSYFKNRKLIKRFLEDKHE